MTTLGNEIVVDFERLKNSLKIEKHHILLASNCLRLFEQSIDIETSGWPIGLEDHIHSTLNAIDQWYFTFRNEPLFYDDIGNRPDFFPLHEGVHPEAVIHKVYNSHYNDSFHEAILFANHLLTNKQNYGFRSSPAFTERDVHGVRIKFPSDNTIPDSLKYISSMNSSISHDERSLARILFKFLLCNTLHPFSDGNKRTFRSMLQLDLINVGFIRFPLIPIGPILHCTAPMYRSLYRDWILRNDADSIITFVLQAIEKTLKLSLSQIRKN